MVSISAWDTWIKNELNELIYIGQSLPDGEEYEDSRYWDEDEYRDYWEESSVDYDAWYEDADTLVRLVHEFYQWAPLKIPDEFVMYLEELVNSVESPPVFEPVPDDDDWRDGSEETYWTIEKMFEDL